MGDTNLDKLSDNSNLEHCVYITVMADSVKELDETVNRVIEQGWEADGAVSGGWRIIGGGWTDGKHYYQTLMKCPTSADRTVIT